MFIYVKFLYMCIILCFMYASLAYVRRSTSMSAVGGVARAAVLECSYFARRFEYLCVSPMVYMGYMRVTNMQRYMSRADCDAYFISYVCACVFEIFI